MPITTNTRRKNAAARTIQAAARAFLAKKYAYTQNGQGQRLAVNKFTGEAIPKSRAIQLRSKNGGMRTWDSLAVYNVVVGGKKVARDLVQYIPLVSASDRTRILELHRLHLDIRMQRLGSQTASSPGIVGTILQLIEGIMGLIFVASVLIAIAAAMGPAVLKAVSLHMNVIRYAFSRYMEMALIPIETTWTMIDSPALGVLECGVHSQETRRRPQKAFDPDARGIKRSGRSAPSQNSRTFQSVAASSESMLRSASATPT